MNSKFSNYTEIVVTLRKKTLVTYLLKSSVVSLGVIDEVNPKSVWAGPILKADPMHRCLMARAYKLHLIQSQRAYTYLIALKLTKNLRPTPLLHSPKAH